MTFRVGQKVVKVPVPREVSVKGHKDTPTLVNGAVYTIRDIDLRLAHIHNGVPTIRLEQVRGPIVEGGPIVGHWECGYGPRSFRPIVEKKTDIGFAHEILRKVTRKQTVRA